MHSVHHDKERIHSDALLSYLRPVLKRKGRGRFPPVVFEMSARQITATTHSGVVAVFPLPQPYGAVFSKKIRSRGSQC